MTGSVMIIVINSVLYSARCLFTANYTQWSRSELIGCYGFFFFFLKKSTERLTWCSHLITTASSICQCRLLTDVETQEFTLNLCVCSSVMKSVCMFHHDLERWTLFLFSKTDNKREPREASWLQCTITSAILICEQRSHEVVHVLTTKGQMH